MLADFKFLTRDGARVEGAGVGMTVPIYEGGALCSQKWPLVSGLISIALGAMILAQWLASGFLGDRSVCRDRDGRQRLVVGICCAGRPQGRIGVIEINSYPL